MPLHTLAGILNFAASKNHNPGITLSDKLKEMGMNEVTPLLRKEEGSYEVRE